MEAPAQLGSLSAWWPRCRLIESSLGSVATKLNFFIHNLAQMKFTGSDARPTLSFAPRTHTIKTSGRIRDVFLCRHERVFNPSKGYVSGDGQGQVKGLPGWPLSWCSSPSPHGFRASCGPHPTSHLSADLRGEGAAGGPR